MVSKKKIAVAIAMTWCGAAAAQSSVTLYGLVDAGVTYTNNGTSNGKSGPTFQFMSGSSQGDRWGLKGTEDLGGGTKALFNLESGYQLSNGQAGQGGKMFGRSAFVGLSGNWGELTLGRQYDFIGWYLPAYAIGANTPAGLLAWSLPAYAAGGYSLDNRVWGDWVDNAVKYVSPTFAGFSFGAMYGFGETPGSVAKNSTMNFVVNYENGPFSTSASYYSQRDAVGSGRQTIYIGGAAYNIGKARIFALVSDVRIHGGTDPRATTAEVGATYGLTPNLTVGGGYQYQRRNNDLGSASQFTASLDYALSKRTDVYTVAAYGHDNAFGAQAVAALGYPSTTSSQFALRIGMRHKF
ncbi:porin [Ralstonia syzygii]|uniref:Putative Outer membrane porin OpcP n=1 Tax=Ralstonia syzygii R24 TaxID=907261 RepID=G3A4D7_9RALS|nr:porin [Ralstonia syzygii]CCA88772.1 putative Outer membrane porin OpcP [Ralstonia syzygii R24]